MAIVLAQRSENHNSRNHVQGEECSWQLVATLIIVDEAIFAAFLIILRPKTVHSGEFRNIICF